MYKKLKILNENKIRLNLKFKIFFIFAILILPSCAFASNVEYLIVAGGGGGGGSTGGGGGGGGLLNGTLAVTAQDYTVTIGAGGNGGTLSTPGTNGGNSVFDSIVAIGGGKGGNNQGGVADGGSGGSGGGASFVSSAGTKGSGTTGQGYDGGANLPNAWPSGHLYSPGGGGGAGGVGANGANSGSTGATGGVGLQSCISGSCQYYAGGGGGGLYYISEPTPGIPGVGGIGGGGTGGNGPAGARVNATSGTANTGGGGGGQGGNVSTQAGSGGSGIVIIRYHTADFGTCTGGTITTDGSDTIHTFTSSGIFTVVSLPSSSSLLCSITTAASCTGTVLLRMSGTTSAHAELPSQSTPAYDNNVVCCTGVTGLGNSCAASNHEVIARLSGVTNAHVEKNTESGVNYTQNACLSSSLSGDQITIGYQSTDCSGYDTTLFSMSSTPTNSQVGIPTAYNNKVCAKVVSQSISFNISDNSVGFGNLISTGLRYATGDGTGSSSETESYNFTANTNAPYGYTVYVSGDSLKNGAVVINPIGGTNLIPSAGSKAFGMRAVASGGVGSVVTPYDGSGFAFDATNSNPSAVASASSGDGTTTTYSIRTVATIDSLLDYGDYSTNLTYTIVPNF